MRIALFILSLCLFWPGHSLQAQQVRYVTDKSTVPLRSGPNSTYRVIHRGIPSGTRLTVNNVSANGEWTDITTDRGTTGWIRSQYLMDEVPAAAKLDAAVARADKASARMKTMATELEEIKAERDQLRTQLNSTDSELGNISDELTALKKISGKAVQLDIDNRRLVVDTENLRSETEMLEAENQRLQEKLRSEDFLNGALAVLLGVIIALVTPRLVPKRRKDNGWA